MKRVGPRQFRQASEGVPTYAYSMHQPHCQAQTSSATLLERHVDINIDIYHLGQGSYSPQRPALGTSSPYVLEVSELDDDMAATLHIDACREHTH